MANKFDETKTKLEEMEETLQEIIELIENTANPSMTIHYILGGLQTHITLNKKGGYTQ